MKRHELSHPEPTQHSKRRGRKKTREEKTEETRAALIRAAAEVVGEHGYTGAMISLITARAGVAQGTFYNYFDSQQDLLDQLLPLMGHDMLDSIQRQSSSEPTEKAREEKRFRAFYSFLDDHPEFYRILYEAEVYSPNSHREHNNAVSRGLTRILERAQKNGELSTQYAPRELEALAYMLMGARHYLCMRYARDAGEQKPLPSWVADTYMKFLQSGIFPVEPSDSGDSPPLEPAAPDAQAERTDAAQDRT